MAYRNTSVLIDVATMIAADRYGTPLTAIEQRLGCCRRTVQRLLKALRREFPDLEEITDQAGRKLVRLRRPKLCDLVGVTAEQLAALDVAIEMMSGSAADARPLRKLRDDILSLLPDSTIRKLDPDRDAILEAQGFVARPGPRPKYNGALDEQAIEAIKALRIVEFDYAPKGEKTATPRRVAPYGILSGLRRYLVAESPAKPGSVRTYRLDRISNFRQTTDSYVKPDDFDLHRYARRSFGAYMDDREYGEVVWRFLPSVALDAKDFVFHPDQQLEQQQDGSLIVRFRACGNLEMAWHLYAWGDKVEVLAPEALREMVSGYQRCDFPATP